jgi:6-phosphogluconolactonase
LLGLGPDGHTCSLFPDRPILQGSPTSLIDCVTDSPKPPSNRITFTLYLCNQAKQVAFVCTGTAKASAIQNILSIKGQSSLPAAMINKPHVTWFLDFFAAQSYVSQ